MNQQPIQQPLAILSEIAKEELSIETLQTRNCTCLDNYLIPVWCLKCALQMAFNAGVNFQQQPKGD